MALPQVPLYTSNFVTLAVVVFCVVIIALAFGPGGGDDDEF